MGLKYWNRWKIYVTGVVTLALMAAALLFAQETESGILRGISICTQTLIPSLFPFLFLSSFLVRSGACAALGRWSSSATRFLFGLPGNCAGLILMSLLGGYPVGVGMAEEMLGRGDITRGQARRMILFCINAGPAFTIASVGTGMIGSTHTGIILYASGAAALALMGILGKFLFRREGEAREVPAPASPPAAMEALTASVSAAVKAMVSICAWVLLFGAAGELIRLLPLPAPVYTAVTYLLEISAGCASAARMAPPYILSAMLSFSGLCVLCQLAPGCRRCGVKMGELLLSRIACAALSAGICALLCRCFPDYVQTSAGFQPLYHAGLSVSIPACAALIVMGLIAINEVDIRRKT